MANYRSHRVQSLLLFLPQEPDSLKLFTTVIFLFFSFLNCYSQNLVLNPSFENYSSCPAGPGDILKAQNWKSASLASPDYYNQCAPALMCVPNNYFGNQVPRTGQAYTGIFLYIPINNDYREYIEASLTSTLIANECYHFEMFVSLVESASFYTDDIGVYFSNSFLLSTNTLVINQIPQITNQPGNYFNTSMWTRVAGDYIATGGENYITIGNFKNNSNTNNVFIQNNGGYRHIYCYIDDVSLTSCNVVLPVDLLKFSALPLKNAVELLWTTTSEINNNYFAIEKSKDSENFTEIKKINGAGNSTININYNFIDENPSSGTSYYRLKQVDFDGRYSYSKIVDVNFSKFKNEIRIEPNPAVSQTTIYFPFELKGETKIEIFNSQGKSVLSKNENTEMNFYLLNLESLEKGLYYLSIENNQEHFRAKMILR